MLCTQSVRRSGKLDVGLATELLLCELSLSIGGTKINNFRYADDTVLLENDPEELNTLIRRHNTKQSIWARYQ